LRGCGAGGGASRGGRDGLLADAGGRRVRYRRAGGLTDDRLG
jgi:hypothetical protein